MESPIQEFYKDKSIFLTGASGFLGQIIIEKLLRCCDVKIIYILVRNKKGKSWQNRVQQMCCDPVSKYLRFGYLLSNYKRSLNNSLDLWQSVLNNNK